MKTISRRKPFEQKSLYSVKQAAAMAFERMPTDFDAITFCNTSKRIMARPQCMDGTILRRLRELRAEAPEKYNYKVVDPDLAKYQKINPPEWAKNK